MDQFAMRVHADTSVYGGVFDDEFSLASAQFFERVRLGHFSLVVSSIVANELESAPERVQDWFRTFQGNIETVVVSESATRLREAYINARIVSPRWEVDALHVAVATVSGCRLIVSWNFKHIVNYQKIPQYNGVNLARGYGIIGIHTPQEVVSDED